MSSSHRSSHSANPLPQPSWREKHKNLAPASVTLVFAEPEQGAPLASASQLIASTQLDTSSAQSSDETSVLSQRFLCRQSLSNLGLQQRSYQGQGSVPIALQYEEEPSSSTTVDMAQSTESPTEITSNNPVDLSSTYLPSFTPAIPSPTRKSWLQKIRRIAGNKIPQNMSFASGPQSDTVIKLPRSNESLNLVHDCTHSHNNHSTLILPPHSIAHTQSSIDMSTSSAKPANDITQPLTFPSSQSSPLTLKADYNDLPPQLIQESIASSVDGYVPVVDLTQTLPSVSSSAVTTLHDEGSNINTLHTSSNRFTFFRRSVKQENAGIQMNDQSTASQDIHKKPLNRLADSSTLPQLLTVESQTISEVAAQDSLQNAMSNSPFILAEAEASPAPDGLGADLIISTGSSTDHTEELTPVNSTIQSSSPSTATKLWSYLSAWSTTSSNSNDLALTTAEKKGAHGSTLPPLNLSGLGQSDSGKLKNISGRAMMNQNLLSPPTSTFGTRSVAADVETIESTRLFCHDVNRDISPTTANANTNLTSLSNIHAEHSHTSITRAESTKSSSTGHNNDVHDTIEAKNMISPTQEPKKKALEDSSKEDEVPQPNSSISSSKSTVQGPSKLAATSGTKWLSPLLWYAARFSVAGDNEDKNYDDHQHQDQDELGMGSVDNLEFTINGESDPVGVENIREHKVQTNQQEETFDRSQVDQTTVAWEQGKQDDFKSGDVEGQHMTSNDAGSSKDSNPIVQSITDKAYISGWKALFSSRRLVLKTLGYDESTVSDKDVKRDGHGVEVMEADFDEVDKDKHSADEISGNSQDQNENAEQFKTRRAGTQAVDGSNPMKSSPGDKKYPLSSSQSPQIRNQVTTSENVKQQPIVADCITNKNNVDAKEIKLRSCHEVESGSTTPVSIPTIDRPYTPMGNTTDPGSKPSIIPPSTALTAQAATSNKSSVSPTSSANKDKEKSLPPTNIVLPTWEDTFHAPPRNILPPNPPSNLSRRSHGVASGRLLGRAMGFVSDVLFSTSSESPVDNHNETTDYDQNIQEQVPPRVMKERLERFQHFGKELPHAWDILEPSASHDGKDSSGVRAPLLSPSKTSISNQSTLSRRIPWRFMAAMGRDKAPIQDNHEAISNHAEEKINDVLRGCRRVVVIGIHGWFPGAVVRTVLGEPTGTSFKFVNMMVKALENFQKECAVSLDKITRIPLEGEGTIDRRVDRLYHSLTTNQEWMDDLRAADAIFVVTHSQGSVVSTHLLNRLIHDRHIRTAKTTSGFDLRSSFTGEAGVQVASTSHPQKICCLSLCGIHLGPLRYLRNSSFVQPYLHYFESNATRELFEFQNTESAASKSYITALRCVLDNGVKMVYVASMNDQVVPIYSGLFTAISHPLILRALYIDGDVYHSSDFLSNLLVLLIRILNSGISDSGLLEHLSEATAGSLTGVGHSTAYEELTTYTLAVKYLFLTNDGLSDHSRAVLESFDATHEQNDYEIPWALRDVIANEHVLRLFAGEIADLRDAFRDWHPKTSVLRDLKRKLQPIQRLSSTFYSGNHTSKL